MISEKTKTLRNPFLSYYLKRAEYIFILKRSHPKTRLGNIPGDLFRRY